MALGIFDVDEMEDEPDEKVRYLIKWHDGSVFSLYSIQDVFALLKTLPRNKSMGVWNKTDAVPE